MHKKKILDFLCENIRRELSDEDFEITLKTEINDIGLNSISFIKILVEIENEYDVIFEDDELDFDQYSSIENLVNIIKSHL